MGIDLRQITDMKYSLKIDPELDTENDATQDEDLKEVMETHDLDQDSAERVLEIMDELGVDEDDAVELENEGI